VNLDVKEKGKKVCVIGSGVSGVVCVKELTQVGVCVDAYEMMPILGGVFGNYSWKGGRFTSSTVFTWYSDFPYPNRQHFFSWEEFLKYLEDYTKHFNIKDKFQFNCKIDSAKQVDSGWEVKIHKKIGVMGITSIQNRK